MLAEREVRMRRAARRGFVWLAAGAAIACGDERESLAGRYSAAEQPSLSLSLSESDDGAITGELTEPGASLPLVAHRDAEGFTGTIGPAGEGTPLRAIAQDDRLVVQIGTEDEVQELTFVRGGESPAPAASAPAASTRQVVINGQRLADADLARIEAAQQIRIPDADYWYDPVLGAWGARGGPTMGFIAPGLALGGALSADASGGGTSVFVNGREIHPDDLHALQRITGPIAPGRYFIDAHGLAGFEGGPPQWNLAALAAPSAGGGGGDSNAWQAGITGASGFSDGHTGAVFLPNGGIVSVGD
jgi:hypothetical protein